MTAVSNLRLLLGVILAATLASASTYSNAYGSGGVYGTNFFADSQSTYWDGYQQAWRYLGWYVKCGYPSDRYEESEDHSQHSGSGDQNEWQGNNYCQRYLIWAAYVDESYQGGGVGEYSYYDPYSQSWDDSACSVHGNGRCAPMDCHDSNTTTWTLMGVFKEASYFGNDAFFEQLFKHEGYCVWNDDDLYEFMSESRESAWTQGCVQTGYTGNPYYFDSSTNNKNYLYLDLKPTWNGNMTYGLYVDGDCKTEYEGMDVDVDKVSASMGLLYGSSLQTWNDAMEVYKVCQPCRAYNLNNQYQSYTGDDYYGNSYNRKLDGDYSYSSDPNNGYFACDDDADYTNVNQCMKFRTHAELEVATWEDLTTATNQGGILEVVVGGHTFGSERMTSEQWQYEVKRRRSKIAERAKQAQLEVEEMVNVMAPKAEQWTHLGKIAIIAGSILLLLAFWRKCCTCRRRSSSQHRQPLLANEAFHDSEEDLA